MILLATRHTNKKVEQASEILKKNSNDDFEDVDIIEEEEGS